MPQNRILPILVVLLLSSSVSPSTQAEGSSVPADFPQYIVPGHEEDMASLRSLFWLHYQRFRPLAPLWDEWLLNASIWPAQGVGDDLNAVRRTWATTLAGRRINAEGYVETHQHDGPAHAEGWPFPTWMQAGGVGWHFRPVGVPGYEAPLATPDGWQLDHAVSNGVDDVGWSIRLEASNATAQSPEFRVPAPRAPWLRLNWWATGLDHTRCAIEWTTSEQPDFSRDRRIEFEPADKGVTADVGETRSMIPMYRHPQWRGEITGLRISFASTRPAEVVVKSIHTASDTRHNVNNLNFIRACHDYFLWTRDVAFLRSQLGRIRTAMRFVEREFQTRDKLCIYTTWPGHEGRSGVVWTNGQKSILPGEGVGSNYWDLLPFGGYDALATVYYYDALNDLAKLEQIIATRPDWEMPTEGAYDSQDLRRHAGDVKRSFGKRFWNAQTGRFGTVDLDGNMHDYGFTFLNNEAVAFGIAMRSQQQSIHQWITGARTVAGDTSTGADIYHWRFGPRSTTRRNIDYYFWGWSGPEDIPWGYQVQDGGAVLGWTYYDLLAHLKTAGPDDAAARLREIAHWYRDIRAAGGYRAYYGAEKSRGTLQGGGTAGGLGLDSEFFESILATQIMLYGFLGFHPTVDGFSIDPQLPAEWPELTVTRIHLHQHVLDVTATRDSGLRIRGTGPDSEVLTIRAPSTLRLDGARGVRVKLVPTN